MGNWANISPRKYIFLFKTSESFSNVFSSLRRYTLSSERSKFCVCVCVNGVNVGSIA